MATGVGTRFAVGVLLVASGALIFAQDMLPGNPESKLAQLAVEAARQGPVTPIPLDGSPGVEHGVLFDRFLLGVLAAKAALAAGRTPPTTVTAPGQGIVPLTMAVVAYPRRCEGRLSPAQNIRLNARAVPAAGAPIQPVRVVATGAAARALLPGVTLPPSALVVGFANAPLNDAIVSIEFTEPLCPATLKIVDLTLQATMARAVRTTMAAPMPPELPALASTQVRVQVVIDRDGSLKYPSLIQGPSELEAAAVAVMKQWQFEPARTNGVATTQIVVLPITFNATSQPSQPPLTASSTGSPGGSDPTHNTTTADVPALDYASSRCPVSDDPTYGFSATNAIKVGGDMRLGPAREVQYLRALRGPNGQGINFRRLGSANVEQTILDVYEISYAGLAAPLRLYLDEYHFEPLKAPAGLVCAAAFGLTALPAPGVAGVPAGRGAPPPGTAAVALTITDDQPGLTAATSKCPVSDDDTYAVSAANAIRLGGGPEAIAREDQYMKALRGPGGAGLRYRRTGSMLAPDLKTMVDVVEVSHGNVAQPIRLYFDRALAETLKAPKGWACYTEIREARERR